MYEFMRINNVKLYVYSNEGPKPHIHVSASGLETIVWLEDLSIKKSSGSREFDSLAKKLVKKHKKQLLEDWHGYFK